MLLTGTEFFNLDSEKKILHNSIIEVFELRYQRKKCILNIQFILSSVSEFHTAKITIDCLKEFYLSQVSDSLEQQIHFYKFIKTKESYYLSLDPDEAMEGISHDDKDLFIFSEFSAIIS